MKTGRPGPVVVGVDESNASEAAVGYAAWEAQRHGLALRLVHGFLVPVPTLTPLAPYYDENELLIATEARFTEVVAGVQPGFPDLDMVTKVVAGSGGKALVDESRSASLIVVGSRGQGGFAGVLLGSVAAQVAIYAHCPVIVVRQRPGATGVRGTGAVVVGIDGSARSADALSFAFDEAEGRGVALIAVHVWSIPEMSARSVGTVWSPSPATAGAQLQDAAEGVLAEALAGWQEKYPQVPVKRWTVHGDHPARTLLDVADEVAADLIVVASRGRSGLGGMLLGSVSQTLVAHSSTSVAVIHPENLYHEER
jgi:nucleotide-binding universal stress UspA family protein